MESMVERMMAITNDPEHPVCRLTNMRLPETGEPVTSDTLAKGRQTLAGLADDLVSCMRLRPEHQKGEADETTHHLGTAYAGTASNPQNHEQHIAAPEKDISSTSMRH